MVFKVSALVLPLLMKDKILNKATNLFLNLGFKSVTMDDLAQEMGISKKTIYSHFENKSKLVEEVSMNLFWVISNGIDQIVQLQKNPIEELYEIKRFVMHQLKDESTSPIFQLQKYYPKIYHTIRDKQFEVMQHCVVENLKRGVAMGIYRANLDVTFVARIYFLGVNNLKDQTYFPSNKFTMTHLMDNFLEYHLRGIVTPEGRKILNSIINSNQQ